ncbi:MAG: non-homologous end-joining DNA ligase, partial [Myxococcaceae bacterium]
MAGKGSALEIEGRKLSLSNLDKVMYPKAGFTKAHVIDYYIRIAPLLLPHLRKRPLTLKRYPNGVEGMFFYEKVCPRHRPSWVKTVDVWSHGRDEHIPFCVVEDIATLVWLANLADLELHTSLSYATRILHPTMMVFDLDPGAPADLLDCCKVALLIKSFFDAHKLKVFAKVSGSKGLQLYVPLNDPKVTYDDDTKVFSKKLAVMLERRHPDLVVSNMLKKLRVGKVLVDWSQNDEHKTTVNVYCLVEIVVGKVC